MIVRSAVASKLILLLHFLHKNARVAEIISIAIINISAESEMGASGSLFGLLCRQLDAALCGKSDLMYGLADVYSFGLGREARLVAEEGGIERLILLKVVMY